MNATLEKYGFHALALLAPFAWIISLWPRIPARVATHFNAHFQPNGWMAKIPGVLAGPVIAILATIVVLTWLNIDPRLAKADEALREHVKSTVRKMMLGLDLWISAVSIALVIAACRREYSMVANAFNYGLPLLMVVWGNYLGKLRPNYVVGIRCGWTLESEIVWTRTHRFSGQLMLGCGLLLLSINAVPHLAERQIWLILGIVGLWLLATLIYAFTAWRAENPAR